MRVTPLTSIQWALLMGLLTHNQIQISPPLTKRATQQNKALKQASDSLHGLGLDPWLLVVESAESLDRKDSAADERARIALWDETASSHGRPMDTAHGPAAISKNAAGQRKRR